ncbi:RpiB/LacA/LacB family sugar-phosphate isomerase [Marivita sp. XM-24bin2]|uniref:D-erythrulose-4-phosphate isomerase n=1 Tax=Marivita sp. XM-24bin2 TaxID=2133951 RepID=UPI000D7B0188|nr:RpiB/LacA/LacB family sugar-phosphate isomerase [Marivita sp. XM-24bin2]PWL33428.1 MAG: ribose-5-phosphate isomerase [Marivita sp. XM-24bin2]
MKIAIAGDSAGEPLAKVVAEHLKDKHEVSDMSYNPEAPQEFYAHMADRVCSAVLSGEYDRAILFCGTGIGVALSANKVPGIRAAQCHDTYSAGKAATSNNAHVITMGARVIGPELAKDIADAFLSSTFDPEGRSAGNVNAINEVDAKYHIS